MVNLKNIRATWIPPGHILLVGRFSSQPRSIRAFQFLNEAYGKSLTICGIRSEETSAEIVGAVYHDLPINDTDPSAPKVVCDEIEQLVSKLGVRTLIIDITALPCHIMLSLCQRLAWLNSRPIELSEIVAVYTKPERYAAILGRAFQLSRWIPFFADRHADLTNIGWIPALGFSAKPTMRAKDVIMQEIDRLPHVSASSKEQIKKDLVLKNTYPLVGWPPYQPDFYNRSIWENQELLNEMTEPVNRLQFASADDPFEIADCIQRFVSERIGMKFICSVQGSQPMNLGCGLACSSLGIQMLYSYPKGSLVEASDMGTIGDSVAYWLYIEGAS